MFFLKPLVNPMYGSIPSSHIEITEEDAVWNGIKDNEIVKVSCGRKSVFLRVKRSKSISSDMRGYGTIHRSIESLLGDVYGGEGFRIEHATIDEIPRCREIHAKVKGRADEIEEYLKKNKYIMHPIHEVIHKNSEKVDIIVSKLVPDSNSVLITESTKCEFKEEFDIERIIPEGGFEKPETGKEIKTEEKITDLDIDIVSPTKSFDDVAGLKEVKDTIMTLISLYEPEIYEKIEENYGPRTAKRSNSILLYGPPGCGKTLVAEAIAKEVEKNDGIKNTFKNSYFIKVKGSDILNKYYGESEKAVRNYFKKAQELAKDGFVVLFFDEVDTLIPDRGESGLPKHDRSLTNQFIAEMNEIAENMLIIGATNLPFTIDPAAARRFPQQLFIPPPDRVVLKKVWEILLKDVKNKENIDYDELSKASVGFTPAEITDEIWDQKIKPELIKGTAWSISTKKSLEPITTDYIKTFSENSHPTTIKKYVSSVGDKMGKMDGYPELMEFVEKRLGEKFNKFIKRVEELDATVYRTGKMEVRAKSVPSRIQEGIFKQPEKHIRELVLLLTKDIDDDFLKVKNIHDWIADNISYDASSYFSDDIPEQSYVATLKRRTSVCAGYAHLVHKMCELSGIECAMVSGYARGYGFDIFDSGNVSERNHDWNAVKIKDNWYLLDVTWDAGYVNGRRKEYIKHYSTDYLFLHPRKMIYTHYPADSEWQLTDKHVTREDCLSMPLLQGRFFSYNLVLKDIVSKINNVEDAFKFRIGLPNDVMVMVNMRDENGKEIKNATSIQRKNDEVEVHIKFPNPGRWKSTIYATRSDEGSYHDCAEVGFISSK